MADARGIVGLAETGRDGLVVTIECALSNSLPGIVIVGFVSKAVDEARERVRSAFAASKLELPRKRITINLAPADVPKAGTGFDLGMAAAILTTGGYVRSPMPGTAILGELGLEGDVRPIRGVIGKILVGQRHGIERFIIPAGNLEQALLVPGVQLIPVATLLQLYEYLRQPENVTPVVTDNVQADPAVTGLSDSANAAAETSLDDIIGQELGKRAVEISAAGGHNLLLGGPPGTGKSMLARALPDLLPALDRAEMLEVTHLHSLAGSDFNRIVRKRPFRAPHHSASHTAIIGGGTGVRPGEMSLAHRGVLLFDELPEFARPTIEALRQPLEARTITIARASDTAEYPANFIFVATANPCPCGHYGTVKPCRCTASQIVQYRRKLSGPILDRIDIYVDVHEIDNSQLLDQRPSRDVTHDVKQRVSAARQRQAERFGNGSAAGTAKAKLNADMSNRDVAAHAHLQPAAKTVLDQAANSFGLSPRAYMRTVKVARTIADLDGSEAITTAHIAEALQYRPHTYHST